MKFPKKKKSKVRTKPQLIKDCDNAMSLYIRELDDYTCICCGQDKSTAVMQNGHLITRGNHAVRYDEHNCFCQCSGCNLAHEHHPEVMTNRFIKLFGAEAYDRLVIKSKGSPKFTKEELEVMVRYFKAETEKIKEAKLNGTWNRKPFER